MTYTEQRKTKAEQRLESIRDHMASAVEEISKEAVSDIADLSVLDEIIDLARMLYVKLY